MKHIFDETREESREQVAATFGWKIIPEQQHLPKEQWGQFICDVIGCGKPSYVAVFRQSHSIGLFVCRHHYGIAKFLEDEEIWYNDFLQYGVPENIYRQ